MRTLLTIILMAALAGTTAAGQDSPVERLRAAAAAAWKGPDFRAAASGLESERAAARLEAHPGAPYTELQREGIDSGFDAAGNAAWYLRLGAPVKAPWQFGAIRNALDATARELEARRLLLAGHHVGAIHHQLALVHVAGESVALGHRAAIGIDVERRGFLGMERAEAFVNGSGRLEADVLTHDLDDVGLVLDPGDDIG